MNGEPYYIGDEREYVWDPTLTDAENLRLSSMHQDMIRQGEEMARDQGWMDDFWAPEVDGISVEEIEAVDFEHEEYDHPHCDLTTYVGDRLWEYFAIMEIAWKFSTDADFRQQVIDAIGEMYNGSYLQALYNASWFGDRIENIDLTIPGLRRSLSSLESQPVSAQRDAEIRELRYQIDYFEQLRAEYVEHLNGWRGTAQERLQQIFSDIWQQIKDLYRDCGVVKTIAIVGIETGFFVAEVAIGTGILRGLRFAARIVGDAADHVQVTIFSSVRTAGDELSTTTRVAAVVTFPKAALSAKYGDPSEVHAGGTLPDQNRDIPDRDAEDMLREQRGQRGDLDPPPADAPDWVVGRNPDDPPGIFRASNGDVAVRHPDTGAWTVPQGLGQHKGSFGEYLGEQDLMGDGYKPVLPQTPIGTQTNRPGIDGIFEGDGDPPEILISEVKYRSGDPFDVGDFPTTGAGPQMGDSWIEGHAQTLFENETITREMRDRILDGDYTPVLQRVGPDGRVQTIDLDTGRDMDTGEQVFTAQDLLTWRDD